MFIFLLYYIFFVFLTCSLLLSAIGLFAKVSRFYQYIRGFENYYHHIVLYFYVLLSPESNSFKSNLEKRKEELKDGSNVSDLCFFENYFLLFPLLNVGLWITFGVTKIKQFFTQYFNNIHLKNKSKQTI